MYSISCNSKLIGEPMEKEIEKKVLNVIQHTKTLTLKETVEEIATKLNLKKHEATKYVYNLWKKGEIELEDPNPPKTLTEYLFSTYGTWFWTIIILITLTATAIYLLPQNSPYIYVRYALGSLFILYLPGHTLIETLYPKEEDLEPLERLALSIGLSLALVPLVGLVLNYTPWGIRLTPIFTALATLTTLLTITATIRKFSYHKLLLKA
mgnify:FL=1